MNFYVIDENNNRVPALDLEGVLAVLNQAIADGSLANITKDSAFVSKLKCCVGGGTHQVAFVDQAKYNELKATNQIIKNCLYFIVDDTTGEETEANLQRLSNEVNELLHRVNNIQQKQLMEKINITEDMFFNDCLILPYTGLYVLNLEVPIVEDDGQVHIGIRTIIYAFDYDLGSEISDELRIFFTRALLDSTIKNIWILVPNANVKILGGYVITNLPYPQL